MPERDYVDRTNTEIVHNRISGTSHGPVVQARDITGGIHFHQAPAASVGTPNLLPPRPRLVDRAESLAELNAFLDEPADVPLTILVTGSAGVGKTALSLAWAHQIRARFPDGQLYADLRAHSHDEPATSQAMQKAVLHAGWKIGDTFPGTRSLTEEELATLHERHHVATVPGRWRADT